MDSFSNQRIIIHVLKPTAMKPDMILQSDALDILFENRNKDYGAYTLRKNYKARLTKSLIASLSAVSLLLLLYYWQQQFTIKPHAELWNAPADPTITQVEIEKKELLKPANLPRRQPATIKDMVPTIVSDNKNVDPLPSIEDLINNNGTVGAATKPGDTAAGDKLSAGTTGGNTEMKFAETSKVIEGPLLTSEVPPEFPGGIQAFQRFMQRNLKADDQLESGQRIVVKARFIVDKDGNVTDIEILQSGGELFDGEVKKALAKMPAWKPGKQNGKNVAVWFSLPVVFQGMEE